MSRDALLGGDLISARCIQKAFRGPKRTFSLQIEALDLPAGSVRAIMGPNGCGKSTLLLLLAGAMLPDAGTILIGGRVSPQTIEGRKHLSYLPEGGFLHPHLSGAVNLEIFSCLMAAAYGQPLDRIRESVFYILDMLGLPREELGKPARTYSVGMRRKIELALTLAVDVPIYLLDMPTSGLDPATRQRLLSILREKKGRGAGLLISTHIPDEAKPADWVLFMKDGRLVQCVRPDEVKNHITSLVVVRFHPSDKARMIQAVDRVRGIIGDGEARLYNVTVEQVRQLLQAHRIEVMGIHEDPPHLGDLYAYLTGDAMDAPSG